MHNYNPWARVLSIYFSLTHRILQRVVLKCIIGTSLNIDMMHLRYIDLNCNQIWMVFKRHISRIWKKAATWIVSPTHTLSTTTLWKTWSTRQFNCNCLWLLLSLNMNETILTYQLTLCMYFNKNFFKIQFFSQRSAFENVICKIATMLSRN